MAYQAGGRKKQFGGKPRQLEFDFSQPAPLEFTQNDAFTLAAKLDEAGEAGKKKKLLVGTGHYSFMDKTKRLFDSLSASPHDQEVLSQLGKSSRRPREYALVLQTMDYTALRGKARDGRDLMEYTLPALESSRDDSGVIDEKHLHNMKLLLKVGEIYDSMTMKWGERQFRHGLDWIDGGKGDGSGKTDIPYFNRKTDLAKALRKKGVGKMRVEGGEEKRLEEVPRKQLIKRYAGLERERLGTERRREKLLDEI